MAYLAKEDYTLRIPLTHLDEILNNASDDGTAINNDLIREDAEQTAQATIQSYLAARFLILDEFAKDSTDNPDIRNKIILKCMIDISIYNIYYSLNPRDMPTSRQNAYDECMEMLQAYKDGDLVFIAPPEDPNGIAPRPEEDGGTQRLILNSHYKFVSKPFTDPTSRDNRNDIV